MKPRILLQSKREVNPLALKIEDIRIEDIAHSLSLINRFNGHTNRPISVAQHSVYVSRLSVDQTDHDCPNPTVCKRCHDSKQRGLQGLLHDAAEAYLGDVTKWLKSSHAMDGYREAEDAAQRVIFKRFSIPLPIHRKIELADRLMVLFEGMKGFGKDFKIDHPNYPPLTSQQIADVGNWGFWSWKQSKESFMDQYRMLTYDSSTIR